MNRRRSLIAISENTTPPPVAVPTRTLAQTMRQPRWIAMLLLALAVAAVFAWLGQWQLERAVVQTEIDENVSETIAPIEEVVEPGSPMYDVDIARMVTATGSFVDGDYLVLSNRLNDGTAGYWVTGHFVADDGRALAVALGWSENRADAEAVAERLNRDGLDESAVTGRILPSEGPESPPDDDPYAMTMMSVAVLINLWSDMDDRDVYSAYVVASEAPDGLTPIHAPPPEPDVEVNWLNIFYAVEWAVFAGFAVFLWFRLVKDAWERENDEAQDAVTAEQRGSDADAAAEPRRAEHVD